MSPYRFALLASILVTPSALSQSPPAIQSAGSPTPLAGLPRRHQPEPTTAAIDPADLMTREYVIADDSMQGRGTGEPGGVRSTEYIAAELKRLGLTPAGEHGTWFQTVPFTNRLLDSASVLQVKGTTLTAFKDFLPVPRLGSQDFLGGHPYGGSFAGTDVPTIWGGRVGDGTTIDSALAAGKVVVFGMPGHSPQGVTWQFWAGNGENFLRYRNAKAIIVALDRDTLPGSQIFRRELLFYRDTTLVTMPVAIATHAAVASLFGPAVPREIGTEGLPVSGHFGYVETATHAPARNVVAILPGSDPKLKGQYVAIGAHADHLGIIGAPVDHDSIRAFNAVARPRGADDPPPREVTDSQWTRIRGLIDSLHRAHDGPRLDSIANGADDDGSGTVLALEIAEAFARAKHRPGRSLLFVWHAAEEEGLYGSEYFSEHPTVSRDSIVAQINMDQMGRGGAEDAPPDGVNSMVVLGARRLSSELGRIADSVNSRKPYRFHVDRSFDQPGDPSQGWCRSDHYMYARYGIPVLFFVSAVWYIDYHMVSDEPQYINYPRLAKVGNYIRDVTTEVANLPHRPVVDGPRPDPHGACVQ
jgi:hypothetical protein